MELLVIAILLTFTGAQVSYMEGPENTLSVVGSNVTLKCLSPFRNCSGTDWQKYVFGASPMTIFKGPRTILNTNVTDRDRYSVDNSSGCDLVIRNVQLTDAGRYICSAIYNSSQVTKTAYLIIVETQPTCTLNVSLDDTVEGDGVQMKCEVTCMYMYMYDVNMNKFYMYTGTDRVSMNWKGVTDAPAAVVKNATMSRSNSVVASAPEVPSFTCEASFAFETHDPYSPSPIVGLATNSVPNVNCSTSAIRVLYSVRDVTLSPSLSNYPAGTVITCTAKGNPSPNFKWQEQEDSGVWMDIQNQNRSQLTIRNFSCKKYRCVAMNVVRGKNHNAYSYEFQVNNTGTLTTVEATMFLSSSRYVHVEDDFSTTTISSSEDRLGFNAGVGIGVGIGFIVAILLASIAFAMLVRHKCLVLHPSPAADGVVRHHGHEMSSAAVDRSTPRTGTALVGEKDSTYASLGEDRDVNEYASLEQRQKAKPKKKSKP